MAWVLQRTMTHGSPAEQVLVLRTLISSGQFQQPRGEELQRRFPNVPLSWYSGMHFQPKLVYHSKG